MSKHFYDHLFMMSFYHWRCHLPFIADVPPRPLINFSHAPQGPGTAPRIPCALKVLIGNNDNDQPHETFLPLSPFT